MPGFPPPPPLSDVLEITQAVLLPAAGAAAVVLASLRILGKWTTAPATLLALFAGLAAGNWAKELMPWTASSSPWQQIPLGIIVVSCTALLTDLTCQALPHRGVRIGSWLLRVVAVVWVTSLFVPKAENGAGDWLTILVVAGMILAEWFLLESLAESNSSEVVGWLVGMSLAAGSLMLYAGSGKFCELSHVLGAALFGILVVGQISATNLRLAIPGGLLGLHGLLASRGFLPDSQIPSASYWLIMLAPLVALPFLIPAVAARSGFYIRLGRTGSVFALLATAIYLAARVEELPWQKEW
jgi:hypothetical protein